MTELEHNGNKVILERYPETKENSLRAWSSAEILALDYINCITPSSVYLFNDRFGVWNCCIKSINITTVVTYASQKKAISQNLKINNLNDSLNIVTPLDELQPVETALIKIPKSLELFELFLQQIHKSATNNIEVICCFMTKYFTPNVLKIANKYFDTHTQSKAWKKARLLHLTKPKKIERYENLIKTISFEKSVLKQHYGVFSSEKIDIGTQFLLQNIKLKESEIDILDLASGNGIIAHEILKNNPSKNLSLIDDFNLAIKSSKMNIKRPNTKFIWDNNLSSIEKDSYDLVVTNPPFHFEYENNIEITLNLFKEIKRVLRKNGSLWIVANKHLNYKTHLENNFIIEESFTNKKFTVFNCVLK